MVILYTISVLNLALTDGIQLFFKKLVNSVIGFAARPARPLDQKYLARQLLPDAVPGVLGQVVGAVFAPGNIVFSAYFRSWALLYAKSGRLISGRSLSAVSPRRPVPRYQLITAVSTVPFGDAP